MRMVLPGIAFTLFLVGCATPTQMSLDEEVKRLCAIDGGIRVYETVKLPSDRFSATGLIDFYRPTAGEGALGSAYLFRSSREWISKTATETSGTKLSRVHISIIRRADSKMLSEMIVYQRAGGDVHGPWFPSSFSCPEISGGEHSLLRSTFARQD